VQSRYMGPADDLAIRRRAEVFNTIKELRRELAKQVDGLASRGMPRPAPFVGRVIEALTKLGAFDAAAVLIG
uniref:hypothetical protein n=1 Tax=Klebsiella pneumoniae TaxID=573 RepID=UPI001952A83E